MGDAFSGYDRLPHASVLRLVVAGDAYSAGSQQRIDSIDMHSKRETVMSSQLSSPNFQLNFLLVCTCRDINHLLSNHTSDRITAITYPFGQGRPTSQPQVQTPGWTVTTPASQILARLLRVSVILWVGERGDWVQCKGSNNSLQTIACFVSSVVWDGNKGGAFHNPDNNTVAVLSCADNRNLICKSPTIARTEHLCAWMICKVFEDDWSP